jgi:hypothetical protein
MGLIDYEKTPTDDRDTVDKERLPKLLKAIYEAVDELEAMFPGRHFTPDGHMIGSLGEALAQYHYRIELSGASAHCHDGVCSGRQVQIKATQGKRIALSSEPEHLLVLSLHRDGSFTEQYNGPGAPVWKLVANKPLPKNGQHQISLALLRRLMMQVPEEEKLARSVL